MRRYQTTDDVERAAGVPVGGQPTPVEWVKVGPLDTSQHILHLILTIVTFGLWAPIWAYLAYRGKRVPVPTR